MRTLIEYNETEYTTCIEMGLHIIWGTWFRQLTFTVHHSIGVYNHVKISDLLVETSVRSQSDTIL